MSTRQSRGFTLVELSIAMAIAGVISVAVFALVRSGAWGSARLTGRASAEQDARLALQAVTQELEQGTQLVYPRPGEHGDAVGFLNERGDAVFYYLARFGDEGADGRVSLRRACLSDPPTDESVAGNVLRFQASVGAGAPGRPPCAVTLVLSTGTGFAGQDAASAGLDAEFATVASLRAVERVAPDDPIAPPATAEAP